MGSSSARLWFSLALLPATLALAACGGSSDESSGDSAIGAKEAVAAFEAAADGYPFEKATSLVDGAVAYGPKNESDFELVAPLNEALGESSILWQVFIFDGPEPPLGEEAAKAVAFASKTFEPLGEGAWLGDNDAAYAAHGNVVVSGPVLEGDPEDETLKRWQAVLDEL